ncbi:MAG: alpha/beta fold hydrolase [Alphaproteobacteria bacterium]|nr:alpha/beta fold hydrolase [Alphaproteobacteria bacterium]
MNLASTEYGAGAGRPIVIAHGLFGSGRNWASVAKALGERFHVFTVDLRNHGDSPWAESSDYLGMAEDLAAFVAPLDRPVVVGHSMGGKVAMVLALTRPALVGGLVAVDIAPVAYRHSMIGYARAMRAIDLAAITRRSQVDEALKPQIPDPRIRLFLMQNLVFEGGLARWRVNLDALIAHMDEIMGFPLAEGAYSGPTLVLAGETSPYVPGSEPAIRHFFPAASIETVPGAGHWAHADRPDWMIERLARFAEGPA